ncbi:unnamed protein product [Urochloa decumbens]|uniref:Secreted protein n=1 Tax=Urochloa decumbens TaxID=240449 RepID=A0ABC9BPG0_9POAL
MTTVRVMAVQLPLITPGQAQQRMHGQVEFLCILPLPVAVTFCTCFVSAEQTSNYELRHLYIFCNIVVICFVMTH